MIEKIKTDSENILPFRNAMRSGSEDMQRKAQELMKRLNDGGHVHLHMVNETGKARIIKLYKDDVHKLVMDGFVIKDRVRWETRAGRERMESKPEWAMEEMLELLSKMDKGEKQ